jgi:cytochrome P450
MNDDIQPIAQALRKVLVFLDPPDHTRIRKLVARVFTPRMVEGHRARIDTLIRQLLDPMQQLSRPDWIRDFANPLPQIVIAEILGVPASERHAFKEWSDRLGALLDPGVSPETFEAGMKAAREVHDFLRGLFALRRRRPARDLVSDLVGIREQGDRLSESELFATCVVLLGAGHLTTTNLLGNAVWALLENPAERQRLRERRVAMETAVEELLRYDSPIQATARRATGAFQVGGRRIAEDDVLILLLGAGNRDPAVFTDPERLDLGRVENPHLSFSQGIHYCLGAHLARLEAGLALRQLLDRFPDFELAAAPERKNGVVSRGLASLPLSLREPRPSR